MLVTNQNKVVKLSDKLNSKTHPHVFAPLREVLENTVGHKCAGFSIQDRAKYKV